MAAKIRAVVVAIGTLIAMMGVGVDSSSADPVDVCVGVWLSANGTTTSIQVANDDPCPPIPPDDPDDPCPGWLGVGPHDDTTPPLPPGGYHTQVCVK